MTYWSTVFFGLRKRRSNEILLPALISIIRRRYRNSVTIGCTEIEYDKFGGKPTGRARTWMNFAFENDKRLKRYTYNISDALNNAGIARINTLTNLAYDANNNVIPTSLNPNKPDMLTAFNFEVCTSKRDGTTSRYNIAAAATPCTYRLNEDSSPCPEKHVPVGGGGGGGGGPPVVIENPEEPEEAVIEEFEVEELYVSAPQVESPALFTESGMTPYQKDFDEWFIRRLTVRYFTSWANCLGITPMVMWSGITFVETLSLVLMELIKDLSPGETFILSTAAHGGNAGKRGQSYFSVDNGYMQYKTISKIFRSAQEGVRIVLLNENCSSGSAIFGGGPYYEVTDAPEDNTSQAQGVKTVLKLDEEKEKSTLEQELDSDGSSYMVPSFSFLTWKNKDALYPPTAEDSKRVNAMVESLSENGNNNQFLIQLSSSPYNKSSYFWQDHAKIFTGSLPNVWLAARAEYDDYLDQYPSNEYIDEDEYDPEDEEQKIRPEFDYTGKYLPFFVDDWDYRLNDQPWIGVNPTGLEEFKEYTHRSEIRYADPYTGSFEMKGYSFMDWFMAARTIAKDYYKANYPTISYTPWVDAYSNALGDYSEVLTEFLESK